MAKRGEAAEAIIERMRESGAVYRLSASQLADLRAQGVPDKVIDYMRRPTSRPNAAANGPWRTACIRRFSRLIISFTGDVLTGGGELRAEAG